MFTAAFVATRHDPHAKAYYQRKIEEGKRHNAAVVCVARRRCNILLTMLKTQTPYQPPPIPKQYEKYLQDKPKENQKKQLQHVAD